MERLSIEQSLLVWSVREAQGQWMATGTGHRRINCGGTKRDLREGIWDGIGPALISSHLDSTDQQWMLECASMPSRARALTSED